MSEQWSVDGPRVIEVGGPDEVPQHVGVRLLAGQVDVVAHDDLDTTTVEVSRISGRPLEISWSNGRLEVSHPKLKWEGMLDGIVSGAIFRSDDRAEVSIAVPRGIAPGHRALRGAGQRHHRRREGADGLRHDRGRPRARPRRRQDRLGLDRGAAPGGPAVGQHGLRVAHGPGRVDGAPAGQHRERLAHDRPAVRPSTLPRSPSPATSWCASRPTPATRSPPSRGPDGDRRLGQVSRRPAGRGRAAQRPPRRQARGADRLRDVTVRAPPSATPRRPWRSSCEPRLRHGQPSAVPAEPARRGPASRLQR